MKGLNCRQFSLLTWNSFIGQFVYPVGGERMEKGMEGGNRYVGQLRASLQDPSNNILSFSIHNQSSRFVLC